MNPRNVTVAHSQDVRYPVAVKAGKDAAMNTRPIAYAVVDENGSILNFPICPDCAAAIDDSPENYPENSKLWPIVLTSHNCAESCAECEEYFIDHPSKAPSARGNRFDFVPLPS